MASRTKNNTLTAIKFFSKFVYKEIQKFKKTFTDIEEELKGKNVIQQFDIFEFRFMRQFFLKNIKENCGALKRTGKQDACLRTGGSAEKRGFI